MPNLMAHKTHVATKSWHTGTYDSKKSGNNKLKGTTNWVLQYQSKQYYVSW